jgi:hypothetical protein
MLLSIQEKFEAQIFERRLKLLAERCGADETPQCQSAG